MCVSVLGGYPDLVGSQVEADQRNQALMEALQANRYALQIEDGEWSGPGAEWILERARRAGVVSVGESHGVREVSEFVSALFQELRPEGFQHLVIETSPWTAEQLTAFQREGGDGYRAHLREHPLSVPFYGWEEEWRLLAQVVRGSEATEPLWGVDQLFAFAPSWSLARLAELAPTPEAEERVASLQAEPEGEAPLSLPQLEEEALASVRESFSSVPEARRILDEMEVSREIYLLFSQGENWASNQMRARYLRRNVMGRFQETWRRDGTPPRLLVKLGAFHTYRARTPNNALDVGNLAVALAEAMGREALNVAVLCGPDSEGADFPAGTVDCWDRNAMIHDPFEELLREEASPVLFDLRALRSRLHQGDLEVEDRTLEGFLWSHDAVVFLPGANPSTPIVPPPEPPPPGP